MSFKIFVTFGCLCIATALVSCNGSGNQEAAAENTPVEALQAPYDPVYYDSLRSVMQTYYQLTDLLTTDDRTAVNPLAVALKWKIDSLPLQLLQMDSTRLEDIKSITSSISAELDGMQGETGFEGKRASYQMVSDMLYDLIKNTGLKGDTVFHQYCPMAFDDKGAYWLSSQSAIRNPYFGKEMLTCGNTKDTLIYK